MTSPDALAHAEDGGFVGLYKVRGEDGTKVPVVAVYRATIAEDAQDAGRMDGVDVWKFRPVIALDDETTLASTAFIVAAVDHGHAENDGHVHADVAVAEGGVPEAAPDTPATSVFKDPAQFKGIINILNREEHPWEVPPDQLDLQQRDTNLSPETRAFLGFSTATHGEVVTLDLSNNQELAATA